MAIIPDALSLTSGEVGTGAAGSVKGARILLSTKTASRVIADVYAVRSDYLTAHRGEVEKLVRGLMKGQEDFTALLDAKASRRSEYQQVMSKAADLLLGSPQATPDVEALLGDCEFVGHRGNVAFFTGKGTTRNLDTLSKEVRTAFATMGLGRGKTALQGAGWSYGDLGRGLKNAAAVADVAASAPKKFDTRKVAARIEQKIAVEPTTWAEEGTLFQIEINFEPNQSVFTEDQYAGDFEEALKIAQTYGGALIVIEGHSDPLAWHAPGRRASSRRSSGRWSSRPKTSPSNGPEAFARASSAIARNATLSPTNRNSSLSAWELRRRSSIRRAPKRSGPPTGG